MMKMTRTLVGVMGLAVVVCGAVYDEAEIHLNFEGRASKNFAAECWLNNGTRGPEAAWAVGEKSSLRFPKTSKKDSIKGQAYDGSGLLAGQSANALQYGSADTTVGSETERAIYNIWSFTWCGWVKQTAGGSPQGRLFYCAPLLELNYRGSFLQYRIRPGDPDAVWQKAIFGRGMGNSQWIFLAVVYDGTIQDGSPNTFVHAGDRQQSVQCIHEAVYNLGRLDRIAGFGSSFILGNNALEGNRPFQGLMDEIRIYGDGTQLPEKNMFCGDSALSIAALEAIRQNDLQ